MEGWNDPMDLSKFEATGKLKINLNKRVAFPLNRPPPSMSPNQQSSNPEAALKTLPAIPFENHGEQNNNIKDDNNADFDAELAKTRVFNTLEKSIGHLNPSIQSNVKTKLKNLEDEWNECDINLQKLLVELVEFIEQKDSKNAGGIQRKIIMKGYNKPWMQGIRQIVFSLEPNESNSNS